MRRKSFAVAAGLLAAVTGLAHAQNDKVNKDDISFKTFDGVLIKGSFYPCPKGANAPVVMLLHKLGSDRTKGDWDKLATQLQPHYAVLSFDFRGHGQSKTILEPEKFWNYSMNLNHLNIKDRKKKILSYADFKTGYVPCLVNDIVAARYDLDNRNDSGQCNTSNIIVIGAEDGAALGMLWMTTEHARPAVYQKGNLFQLNPGNNAMAAEDIAGAIWLSFSRNVHGPKGGMTFPYNAMVSPSSQIAPTLRDRIPMWFAVGQNDKEGLNDANYLYDTVLRADAAKIKLDTTFKKPIAGTNLRGAALLGKANLSTDDDIEKYIKKLVEKRPNAAPKKRNASEFEPSQVPLQIFGFGNGYPYP